MVKFNAPLLKFQKKGEKTSWTYIEVSAKVAGQLKPGSKVSFRVKGKLDSHPIAAMALFPMGGGKFILPLKAEIRKILGKERGDTLTAQLELDEKARKLSAVMLDCLKAEPPALAFFKTLPPSHQYYFSKWIEDAKTIETKTKRITMTVTAMANKMGYSEMMRAYRDSTL